MSLWILEQPRRPKAGDKITFPSSNTPCNVKNGACVPKCSDLSAEEISRGAQCASDIGKSLHYTKSASILFAVYVHNVN